MYGAYTGTIYQEIMVLSQGRSDTRIRRGP